MRSEVGPAHWLVLDCLAALIQAARALDDPGLLASASLHMINAREEVLLFLLLLLLLLSIMSSKLEKNKY